MTFSFAYYAHWQCDESFRHQKYLFNFDVPYVNISEFHFSAVTLGAEKVDRYKISQTFEN